MPLTIPPELKKITPYVRRAEELDKDKVNAESRLVAYYCRQYAVHTGIGLATSPTGKACLGELLSALEEEKEAMSAFNRDEAQFLCGKFADKIFDKADLEDRSGKAGKDTAKTFYAAASFLEILQQFYKDEDESEEVAEIKKKAVYAKWKATDILRAIKEGREPTPGGYGEETAMEEDSPAAEVTEQTEAPKVETVTDEDEEKEGGPEEPEAPVVRLPSTENGVDDIQTEEEEEPKDEGTEVELGPPPPAYDFSAPANPPPAPSAPVYKPPLSFSPPPVPPPMPAPPVVKPAPAPKQEKSSGIFGFGKKKAAKLSKAEFADATELTRFALAALDERDADLAAERLKQALNVLGR